MAQVVVTKSSVTALGYKEREETDGSAGSYWTKFVAAAKTRFQYVDKTAGSDASDGESAANAVETLDQALTNLAAFGAGPHWLLLKRGETWALGTDGETLRLQLSGESRRHPLMIAAYGDTSDARPVINVADTGDGIVIGEPGLSTDYVAIVSVHLSGGNEGSSKGLVVRGSSKWVLLEDVLVEGFGGAGISIESGGGDSVDEVWARRCVLYDNYDDGGRTPGLFSKGAKAVYADECVFDLNGLTAGTDYNTEGHNLHLTAENEEGAAHVRRCVFMRSGATQCNVACGGDVVQCFFQGGYQAIAHGYTKAESAGVQPVAGGVHGLIWQNTSVELGVVPEKSRHVLLANQKGPTVIEDNLLAHLTGDAAHPNAGITYRVSIDGASVDVGIHNTRAVRNLAYGISQPIEVEDAELDDEPDDGTETWRYRATFNVIEENTLNVLTVTKALWNVRHDPSGLGTGDAKGAGFQYLANVYWNSEATSAWFRFGGAELSQDDWLTSSLETGHTFLGAAGYLDDEGEEQSFTDVTRTVELYRDDVESLAPGTSTLSDFVNELRAQRKYAWDHNYGARQIAEWFRVGFDRAPVEFFELPSPTGD